VGPFSMGVAAEPATFIWATRRRPTHDELARAWSTRKAPSPAEFARRRWEPTVEVLREERRKAASLERARSTRWAKAACRPRSAWRQMSNTGYPLDSGFTAPALTDAYSTTLRSLFDTTHVGHCRFGTLFGCPVISTLMKASVGGYSTGIMLALPVTGGPPAYSAHELHHRMQRT
jgi:hypothetical protein